MSSNTNWKDILGVVAPTIASAVGSPFLGMAVKVLSSTLLGTEEASIEEVQTALEKATPEQLLAVKKADQEFKVTMKALDVDLTKIHQADRVSARDLYSNTKSIFVPSLSLLTVVGFFVLVWYLVTGEISMDNTLLGIVIGHVASKVEQVYNFHYGSSEGSKKKYNLDELRNGK